jgi:predicted alpha/beta superfamily hydrolase
MNLATIVKNLVVLSLFVAAVSLSALAQVKPVAGVVYLQHTFKSEIMGEERSILVHVPAGYTQSDEKFPVVYMLDANPQNAMMVGIVDQQARANQIPEMIVVGIQNTNRNRDLTPTDMKFPGERGGGEKFMQFVEKELVPMIEKNYRTQPFRIFAGHSFGGLTVVYSFVSRPDLFDAYIASSPALHWDERVVIKRAAETFKQKRDWKKTMFMSIANEPGFLEDANAFRDVLKKSNPKSFDYEFRQFKDEDHSSASLVAYYAGLRKIFAGWKPVETATIDELESHYKDLSKRFGYKILIPETAFGRIGGQFVLANQLAEAIEIFKKAIETYPNSAAAYNALAIMYERNNQNKLAKENYEKAFKLAETQENTQLAKEAKANFDRISAKTN